MKTSLRMTTVMDCLSQLATDAKTKSALSHKKFNSFKDSRLGSFSPIPILALRRARVVPVGVPLDEGADEVRGGRAVCVRKLDEPLPNFGIGAVGDVDEASGLFRAPFLLIHAAIVRVQ